MRFHNIEMPGKVANLPCECLNQRYLWNGMGESRESSYGGNSGFHGFGWFKEKPEVEQHIVSSNHGRACYPAVSDSGNTKRLFLLHQTRIGMYELHWVRINFLINKSITKLL